MLVIRFFRIGKKNQPSFKIIVCDKRRPPRGGRFVEEVGFWNPLTKEKGLKSERIKYWLSVGAKPSASVYNLLLKEKIIKGKRIPLHKKRKKGKEEKTGSAEGVSASGGNAGNVEVPQEKEKKENSPASLDKEKNALADKKEEPKAQTIDKNV